ncbi:MAG: IS4 family transposase [Chloroflexota bacterium]
MSKPSAPDVLQLFLQVAPPSMFSQWAQQQQWRTRSGVYSPAVVIWLMIFQRLNARGTLSTAVAEVVQGRLPAGLLVECKRLREDKVSRNTSGYCRARQHLPLEIAEHVLEHILTTLLQKLGTPSAELAGPVYLLDGSSLQLGASRELRRLYPPGQNQHGRAHWPVLRVLVAHDLATGLATRPQWGPMYGANAVSEQALAETILDQLPAQATVMGDRNFGIFSVAYGAHRRRHPVLLRLTKARALHLCCHKKLRSGTEQAVVWQASPYERRRQPHLPADAEVPGRVVACALPGWRPIYLFTTLTLPAEKLIQLYALRWNIETDLRSLKQTVRLHRIDVQSQAMMEKELLLAISAYNLVRAVMTLAAQAAAIPVRQLSFTHILDLVEAFLHAVSETPGDEAERFARLVRQAATCRLPQRRRRRSFPRQVWGSGYRYPRRRR